MLQPPTGVVEKVAQSSPLNLKFMSKQRLMTTIYTSRRDYNMRVIVSTATTKTTTTTTTAFREVLLSFLLSKAPEKQGVLNPS